MKKTAILGIIFFLCMGIVSGQESAKNTISAGVNFSGITFSTIPDVYAGGALPIVPGFSIEYERSLNKNFSVSVDVGAHTILFPYLDLRGRWYPWAKMFFADIGVGLWGVWPGVASAYISPAISPGIGWKIDIGESSNWVLITRITERILLYRDETFLSGALFLTKIDFSIGYEF